jgi:SAM-dependent methyltransferase
LTARRELDAMRAIGAMPAPADPAAHRVAPDGSPIDVYRRLPESGEAALIASLVPHRGSILDVGCGPGRIAGPLSALGFEVTGIDDSAAMIDALPAGVVGIVADARSVRLDRRFDAVLVLSHLLNDPDAGPGFAATARAHVEAGGIVIGEVYPGDWQPEAAVGRESRIGAVTLVLTRAVRRGDRVDAEVRYAVDGRAWRQPFVARVLGEEQLQELLASVGLRVETWLDRAGWFVARPEDRSDVVVVRENSEASSRPSAA